jgi:hypothetical protein
MHLLRQQVLVEARSSRLRKRRRRHRRHPLEERVEVLVPRFKRFESIFDVSTG